VVAIEKDWVPSIGISDSIWLSETNSMMRRIDLSCKMFGPSFVGIIYTTLGPQTTLLVMGGGNILLAVLLIITTTNIYRACPHLANKGWKEEEEEELRIGDEEEEKNKDVKEEDKGKDESNKEKETGYGSIQTTTTNGEDDDLDDEKSSTKKSMFESEVASMMSSFNKYGRHHLFLPLFSYSMLYLTVLSIGGIMVSFLRVFENNLKYADDFH